MLCSPIELNRHEWRLGDSNPQSFECQSITLNYRPTAFMRPELCNLIKITDKGLFRTWASANFATIPLPILEGFEPSKPIPSR